MSVFKIKFMALTANYRPVYSSFIFCVRLTELSDEQQLAEAIKLSMESNT
jgi:hypothetical protein